MPDKLTMIEKWESQLEKIDEDIENVLKEIDQAHRDSEIPLDMRKKMEELIDLRKDFADRLQEIKMVAENSWEELEKGANQMLNNLSQSVESLNKGINKF